MIEVAACAVMLAAALAAYGSPAGVLDALGAGDAGAWGVVRSLAFYLLAPLAVGWALVRWTGDDAA